MRIDFYFFREWAKLFVLAVAAILGLLVLSEVYNELPGFLKREAPPEVTLGYFLRSIPGYLPSLLPVCFLLSLLFSLAVHQRNGEIVAVRAAGTSLPRLSRPFWFAAGILAATLFWLNASLAPRSLEEARRLKEEVKEEDLDRRTEIVRGTMEDLSVYLPEREELWFVEVFRRSSVEAFGVSVSLPAGTGGHVRHEAARGRYDEADGRWILEDGFTMVTPAGGGLPETQERFERIALEDSALSPAVLLGLSQRPRDLTFLQLDALLDRMEAGSRTAAYRTRYLSILAAPFQFFVVVMIALPCALGSGRQRVSKGFVRAIWLYVAFFGVSALFTLAGQRGIFPPAVAAWAPFVLAATAGAWMYRRYR